MGAAIGRPCGNGAAALAATVRRDPGSAGAGGCPLGGGVDVALGLAGGRGAPAPAIDALATAATGATGANRHTPEYRAEWP
ncbi:MAG TPA: hypothetical protein VMV09_03890 [Candidatus Saccharimonadales bacterium]|nr:hypothetical protein [Candidatus Saccharimonadales bacterium]